MKIQDLLTDSSKWTQNTFARNEEGNPTRLEAGVCWCLLGAVRFCYPNDGVNVEAVIRKYAGVDSITCWNDNPFRKFSDIKTLITELDI